MKIKDKKNINLFFINIIALYILLLISNKSYCNNKDIKNNQETLGKMVAIVNNDVITDIELNNKISMIKKQMTSPNTHLPPDKTLKKQVLNSMILEKLELQVAELNNIYVSPDQVENIIGNIAKQNNMTQHQFKQSIINSGLDFNNYKKELVKQVTIMNVEKAIANSEIKISNQEIEQEISRLKTNDNKNSYRLSQILISVPDSPNSKKIQYAKKRAENIIKELNNGKDFKQISMIVSDGPQALKGGDLGWFNFVDLPTIFSDIVPTLKQGQIYGPIQSESGFHIVKLDDVKYNSNKYQETQYKVRHILLKTDEIINNIAAEKELNKLRTEILAKNNFADIALIYSEDVPSASKGGDLGWISIYSVVPEFAEVIKSLKKNEISKPFKTPYGWHIAQLEGTKSVDNTRLWQENQARQIIQSRKFNDALAAWQNKLKSEALIKVLI